MKSSVVSNRDNVIDSRDIIDRIEELKSELDCLVVEYQESGSIEERDDALKSLEVFGMDVDNLPLVFTPDGSCDLRDYMIEYPSLELKSLLDLAEECEGYAADWAFGEALVRDSFFQEYAQELAEDIGAVSDNMNWPKNCIDWDMASDQLKMDYTCVDFDGIDYWIR